MADLYLVRHGQASFGAADYDKLSALGERQAALLGRWLKTCGIVPDAIASGCMRRQLATAALCVAESGGPGRDTWAILDGLVEYDHDSVVSRHRPDWADPVIMHAALAKTGDSHRAFHTMYLEAVARWTGGQHDSDYPEPWPAFKARVTDSLRRLTSMDARSIFAFTSGGPITAVVQHLLGLPDARAFEMSWPLVNAGMTRLRFSKETRTLTLATYNAHPHLDATGEPGLVTFR